MVILGDFYNLMLCIPTCRRFSWVHSRRLKAPDICPITLARKHRSFYQILCFVFRDAKAGLKFKILSLRPFKCWDYRYEYYTQLILVLERENSTNSLPAIFGQGLHTLSLRWHLADGWWWWWWWCTHAFNPRTCERQVDL